MPAPAPTLAEIWADGHRLSVHCARCRVTTEINLEHLGRGKNSRKPVDHFRFRCERCGRVGKPIVTAAGDDKTGGQRVWPF